MKEIPYHPIRIFVDAQTLNCGPLSLGQEHRHPLRVLRARTGQTISVLNGRGYVGHAVIEKLTSCDVQIKIVETFHIPQKTPRIHLIQAVVKQDKADWIVQKTTELGVASILFTHTQYSVPTKKPHMLDRWKKISEEACRQSQEAYLPHIQLHTNLESCLESMTNNSLRLLCHELERDRTLLSYLLATSEKPDDIFIAIGPEGGWSSSEVDKFHEKSFNSSMLHINTLRSETASIAAVAILASYMLK